MRPQNRPTFPRILHPGAWWLWALGLAAAASRTENPVPLLLIIAVTWFVVAARRSSAPWARSYGAFLKLSLAVFVCNEGSNLYHVQSYVWTIPVSVAGTGSAHIALTAAAG